MVILDTRTVCICCAQNMNIVNIVLKKIQSNYNKVLNNTEAVVLTENTEDRCIVTENVIYPRMIGCVDVHWVGVDLCQSV